MLESVGTLERHTFCTCQSVGSDILYNVFIYKKKKKVKAFLIYCSVYKYGCTIPCCLHICKSMFHSLINTRMNDIAICTLLPVLHL